MEFTMNDNRVRKHILLKATRCRVDWCMGMSLSSEFLYSMHNLHKANLVDILGNSLSEVFDTMLSYSCENRGYEDLSGQKPGLPELGDMESSSAFIGSVGFTGQMNGVLYLFAGSNFAYEAASKLTGLEPDELDSEMVADVCGELTNMLAGSFKSSLAKFGLDSNLTIPTVLSGEDLLISSVNAEMHLRNAFLVNGRETVVDVALGE